MKVTNGEIRMAKEALPKLINLRIPVSLSFKLARLANKVNRLYQDMEVVRLKLVNQHGTKAKDGNINIEGSSPEEQGKFWTEFVELLNQEVEVNIEPIKLPETLEVEPSTLMPLVNFLEE